MLFESIIWEPNRYIFTLPNGIAVSYYGVFYTVSFLLSIWFGLHRRKPDISKEDTSLFIIAIAIGSVIGARLGFVIFYGGNIYWYFPVEILKIWKGGMSSHGGGIGILIGLSLFQLYIKKPFLWLTDRALHLCLLAGSLIRIGNFINSEKAGIKTDANWGVIFKNSPFFCCEPRHPTQLYEALICFILFLIILNCNQKIKNINGVISSNILISLFGVRFFIGYFLSDTITMVEQLLNVFFTFAGILLFVKIRNRE